MDKDKRKKNYCVGVEKILYRDYIGRTDCRSRWVETVLKKVNLEDLLLEGYTEEAAAQKIFEENSRYLKPEGKTNRLNREDQGQGVAGMETFQVLVKADRYYSRLPTEIAKMLFQRILQILNGK